MIVREAYEDLGLGPPSDTLPLDVGDGNESIRSVDDIVEFHLSLFRAGKVEACLTCVDSVYRTLHEGQVRTWRITHAKSVYREALRQAHLRAQLAVAETTQPAVVLISVAGMKVRSSDGGSYELQRRRLQARQEILDFAEGLQGRLADLDDDAFIVYTSRGTIEDGISRMMSGHAGPLDLLKLPSEARVGVGLGATVAAAEANARRASVMGERTGDLHVAFSDGNVFRANKDYPPTTYHLREMNEPIRRLAGELGLGPLALTRLTRALQQVDASGMTATDLSRAYGIEPRSARRLISALQRTGIAIRLGRQGGPRGRPHTVYRIDLDRLLPAADGR
ncbi:MAG: hypothetical protein ABI473_11540 [Candidatus Dormibacter sp.]